MCGGYFVIFWWMGVTVWKSIITGLLLIHSVTHQLSTSYVYFSRKYSEGRASKRLLYISLSMLRWDLSEYWADAGIEAEERSFLARKPPLVSPSFSINSGTLHNTRNISALHGKAIVLISLMESNEEIFKRISAKITTAKFTISLTSEHFSEEFQDIHSKFQMNYNWWNFDVLSLTYFKLTH